MGDLILGALMVAVGYLFMSRIDGSKLLGLQPADWVMWIAGRPAMIAVVVGVLVFFGLQISWQAVVGIVSAIFAYAIAIEAQKQRPAPSSVKLEFDPEED